jgi:hypothetical protein
VTPYTAIISLPIIFAAFACGSSQNLVSPSTTTASTTGTAESKPPQTITVGQSIKRTWTEHGALDDYELTAPSDGTLVVRLTWSSPPDYASVDLMVANRWIRQDPPVVATLAVTSGQRYRLTVADRYAWDYDRISVEYVLTATME